MPTWPAHTSPSDRLVHTTERHVNGAQAVLGPMSLASAVYPGANRVVYTPFRIGRPTLIRKLFWMNGTAVAGNVDCGIYDAAGTLLVSTGSTAQSGTSALQTVDVTDYLVGPGLFYEAIQLSDATTATLFRSLLAAELCRVIGMAQEATAGLPLPATASFASVASAYAPHLGFVTELVGV